MSNRNYMILAACCVLISGSFFALACIALWKNYDYAGGNHSFLFATPLERWLQGNSRLLPLAGSAPLLIPVFLRRNVLSFFLVLCAVALFLFLYYVLVVLLD